MLKLPTEQRKFAEKDFTENYADWSSPAYNEQDWSKAQELKIRELLNERNKMASICQNAKSLECPQFLKHVSSMPCRSLVLIMSSMACSTTSG